MAPAGPEIVRVPERFDELSSAMQRALVLAHLQGVPTIDPRGVNVQRRTAQVMEQSGLLVREESRGGRELWRPSDVGRGLLSAHEPRFLHKNMGTTTDPAKAMYPDAGEVLDDVPLVSSFEAALTEERRYKQLLAERARMPVLERLRLAQEDARRRDVVIDRQMHVIAQRVRAIEELVYRPADRIATS